MFEILVSSQINGIVNLITLLGVGINIFIFINKNRKDNTVIDIFLKIDDKKYKAKYSLLRKFVQRSEIKGVLRDLLKQQNKGFSINYLSSEKFIKNILDVQKGKSKEIVIECTPEEFSVFDEKNFTLINK